jgi:hypothetical protein
MIVNARHAVSAAIMSVVVIMSQSAMAKSPSVASPLSGQYSESLQGSQAYCLDPTTFAFEDCSTSGAIVAPVSYLANGSVTYAGDVGCKTHTVVVAAIPPTNAPVVLENDTVVITVTGYDPTTRIGTTSFIGYEGGSCNGASFDSKGATENASGTGQFVVTQGGNQINVIVTLETNPTNSVMNTSLSGTELYVGP